MVGAVSHCQGKAVPRDARAGAEDGGEGGGGGGRDETRVKRDTLYGRLAFLRSRAPTPEPTCRPGTTTTVHLFRSGPSGNQGPTATATLKTIRPATCDDCDVCSISIVLPFTNLGFDIVSLYRFRNPPARRRQRRLSFLARTYAARGACFTALINQPPPTLICTPPQTTNSARLLPLRTVRRRRHAPAFIGIADEHVAPGAAQAGSSHRRHDRNGP